MKKFPVIIVLAAIFLSSCAKEFIGKGISSSPVNNFESVWQDFDLHYGAFGPKKIDWQGLHDKYRPSITENMTDRAFFDTLSHMLDALDDDHVFIRPTAATRLPWYSGGVVGRTKMEDFDSKVAASYLSKQVSLGRAISYGFYPGNIGYINLKSFDEDFSWYGKPMDEVLNQLKDTKGIVIELRENDGGEDRVSQYIADRFATSRHLAFSAALRSGPGHNDFSDPILFYTRPEGNSQYTKPIILLTNLNTFSSGETFVLAMLQNENVKIVGSVTGGALSDAVKREMPNGWLYRLPIADVRDAAGKSLEGIGIQPHYEVKNTKDELRAGHDKAMEKALDLLK